MKLEQLKNDTQRIAESLREIETQLQNLQNKRRQLDSTFNADTTKLNQYKRLLEDPEANVTSWLKEQGLPPQLGLLSRIKDFQSGIINPLIEEVKNVKGEFISVWHNESFAENSRWKGWKKVYEDMIVKAIE